MESDMCGRKNLEDAQEIDEERRNKQTFDILQTNLKHFTAPQAIPTAPQIDKMWSRIIQKTRQMP